MLWGFERSNMSMLSGRILHKGLACMQRVVPSTNGTVHPPELTLREYETALEILNVKSTSAECQVAQELFEDAPLTGLELNCA